MISYEPKTIENIVNALNQIQVQGFQGAEILMFVKQELSSGTSVAGRQEDANCEQNESS